MAHLFQRRQAAVDFIPEDNTDPDQHGYRQDIQDSQDAKTDQEYLESNQGIQQMGQETAVIGSVLSKEATELVHWAKGSRAHVALKVAGTDVVIASWWDEHVASAIEHGDLEAYDLHTSAYRYAAKYQLLPEDTIGKKATLVRSPTAGRFPLNKEEAPNEETQEEASQTNRNRNSSYGNKRCGGIHRLCSGETFRLPNHTRRVTSSGPRSRNQAYIGKFKDLLILSKQRGFTHFCFESPRLMICRYSEGMWMSLEFSFRGITEEGPGWAQVAKPNYTAQPPKGFRLIAGYLGIKASLFIKKGTEVPNEETQEEDCRTGRNRNSSYSNEGCGGIPGLGVISSSWNQTNRGRTASGSQGFGPFISIGKLKDILILSKQRGFTHCLYTHPDVIVAREGQGGWEVISLRFVRMTTDGPAWEFKAVLSVEAQLPKGARLITGYLGIKASLFIKKGTEVPNEETQEEDCRTGKSSSKGRSADRKSGSFGGVRSEGYPGEPVEQPKSKRTAAGSPENYVSPGSVKDILTLLRLSNYRYTHFILALPTLTVFCQIGDIWHATGYLSSYPNKSQGGNYAWLRTGTLVTCPGGQLPVNAKPITGYLGIKASLFIKKGTEAPNEETQEEDCQTGRSSSKGRSVYMQHHGGIHPALPRTASRDCDAQRTGRGHTAASFSPFAAAGTLKQFLEAWKQVGYTHKCVSLPGVVLFTHINGLWHQTCFISSYPEQIEGQFTWGIEKALDTCPRGELPKEASPIAGYLGIKASLFIKKGTEAPNEETQEEDCQTHRNRNSSYGDEGCGGIPGLGVIPPTWNYPDTRRAASSPQGVGPQAYIGKLKTALGDTNAELAYATTDAPQERYDPDFDIGDGRDFEERNELTLPEDQESSEDPERLEFVLPMGPGWLEFVEKLHDLADGSEIQTEDGYTLVKHGDVFANGEIQFHFKDFKSGAQFLLPAIAIKQAIIASEVPYDRSQRRSPQDCEASGGTRTSRMRGGSTRGVHRLGALPSPRLQADARRLGSGQEGARYCTTYGKIKDVLLRFRNRGFTHFSFNTPQLFLAREGQGGWEVLELEFVGMASEGPGWAARSSLKVEPGLPNGFQPISGYLGIKASLFNRQAVISSEVHNDRTQRRSSQDSETSGSPGADRMHGGSDWRIPRLGALPPSWNQTNQGRKVGSPKGVRTHATFGKVKDVLLEARSRGFTHFSFNTPQLFLAREGQGGWEVLELEFVGMAPGGPAWEFVGTLQVEQCSPTGSRPISGYLGIKANLFKHQAIISSEVLYDGN